MTCPAGGSVFTAGRARRHDERECGLISIEDMYKPESVKFGSIFAGMPTLLTPDRSPDVLGTPQ